MSGFASVVKREIAAEGQRQHRYGGKLVKPYADRQPAELCVDKNTTYRETVTTRNVSDAGKLRLATLTRNLPRIISLFFCSASMVVGSPTIIISNSMTCEEVKRISHLLPEAVIGYDDKQVQHNSINRLHKIHACRRLYVVHDLPPLGNHLRKARKVVVQQNQMRRVARRLTSSRKRDCTVGLAQSKYIVYAVTRHCHRVSRLFDCLYQNGFLLGRNPAENCVFHGNLGNCFFVQTFETYIISAFSTPTLAAMWLTVNGLSPLMIFAPTPFSLNQLIVFTASSRIWSSITISAIGRRTTGSFISSSFLA